MLRAVATCFQRSHPACWKCAVTKPTVYLAGLEPADHQVGATFNPAFTCTTAMCCTETLALRGGGTAPHRARLFVSTAMDAAMFRYIILCVLSAAIKRAPDQCSLNASSTATWVDAEACRDCTLTMRLAIASHFDCNQSAVTNLTLAVRCMHGAHAV